MNRWASVILTASFLFCFGACARAGTPSDVRPRERVVGLPCEGCTAVFDGLPATLASNARIAPRSESGSAMRIVGTVFTKGGQPAAGVIVYAYHTNSRGIYPANNRLRAQAGSRHGLLRGWARTDAKGQYRFDTIRPAGYPGTDIPEHIHLHVIEVGRCTYYIDDIIFEDDPRLLPEVKRQMSPGRGGIGVVMPRKDASGTWTVKRDILLGERIPGYPEDSR